MLLYFPKNIILLLPVLIYYMIIVCYNPVVFGFNLSNVYLLSLVLIVSICKFNFDIKAALPRNFIYSYGFYYFILGVHTFISINFEKSLFVLVKMIMPMLFFCILYCTTKRINELRMILHMLGFTNVVACFVGIYNLYFSSNPKHQEYLGFIGSEVVVRMIGAFEQPNVFAAYLVLTVPFAVLLVYRMKWCFIFGGFVLSLNAFALWHSYSRWSIVSLILAVIVSVVLNTDNFIKLIQKTILVGLLVCVVVGCLLIGNGSDYFIHGGSDSARLDSIIYCLEFWVENNLMGNGLGLGLTSSVNPNMILDSTVLNILVDCGVLGILAYIILMVNILFEILKKDNFCAKIRKAILLSFVTFLMLGILESVLYNTLLNTMLAIYSLYIVLKNKEIKSNVSGEVIEGNV